MSCLRVEFSSVCVTWLGISSTFKEFFSKFSFSFKTRFCWVPFQCFWPRFPSINGSIRFRCLKFWLFWFEFGRFWADFSFQSICRRSIRLIFFILVNSSYFSTSIGSFLALFWSAFQSICLLILAVSVHFWAFCMIDIFKKPFCLVFRLFFIDLLSFFGTFSTWLVCPSLASSEFGKVEIRVLVLLRHSNRHLSQFWPIFCSFW